MLDADVLQISAEVDGPDGSVVVDRSLATPRALLRGLAEPASADTPVLPPARAAAARGGGPMSSPARLDPAAQMEAWRQLWLLRAGPADCG